MTRDAFVSYAARDSAPAHLVCSGLTSLGIRVWLDTEDLRTYRGSGPNATGPSRESVRSPLAGSKAGAP
jgi:hypothetical protein